MITKKAIALLCVNIYITSLCILRGLLPEYKEKERAFSLLAQKAFPFQPANHVKSQALSTLK
jgi:hypothetical protein